MTKFCSAFHEILAFWLNRTRKQEIDHYGLGLTQFYFHSDNSKIKIPLMLCTKFQPNIPSGSGEKVKFAGLAIFSISGHFLFSTRLNSIILRPCRLVMLHVKFESYGCTGFRK